MTSNKFKLLFIAILAISLLSLAPALAEDYDENQIQTPILEKAKVLEIFDVGLTESEAMTGFLSGRELVKVRVLTGEFKGKVIEVEDLRPNNPAYSRPIKPGDHVLVGLDIQDNGIASAHIAELARDRHLLFLLILFIVALIVIGGKKGFKAFIALVITGIALIKLMLPAILAGINPIAVTVLFSIVIATITLLIVGGFQAKSAAAIVGTAGGVLLAGLIAFSVGSLIRLTGLTDEEAQMLLYIPQQIQFDFQGLLFAGIIIGALGAVMDVAISVASSIEEIARANDDLSPRELFKSGMNVGKDVIGTMSNTLILAYTGSALPLLLLFMAYDSPLAKIINLDLIATEIVRALAGSIGLIVAVPITAICASIIIERRKSFTI